jgi:Ca2+-binding RTX toxin-like protein
MPTARARRATLTAGLALVVLPATAITAHAVHWPNLGGDNGRSGYQPVNEGRLPVKSVYNKTDASEQGIRSSIITSVSQRVSFATSAGNIHLQTLDTGAPVGPEAGTDVDDGAADADVFGSGDASVSFTDTSGPGVIGQIFAVHNDDNQGGNNDIAIAQVNEENGTLVQDVPVAGTDGYTVSSSIVGGGPAMDDPLTLTVNETGNRALFFVASNGTDEKLFRVPVTNNAGSPGATIGTATSTADINATPTASPSVSFLTNSSNAQAPFVSVGTQDGRVLTFAASNLAAGPASAAAAGRTNAQTPTVPVTPSGFTPGAPNSGAAKAPFIYVATQSAGGTTVLKLTQNGNSATLDTVATSEELAGTPAPALATDQEIETGGGEAKVIVTTGVNLYTLNTQDLRGRSSLSATALLPGATGFSRTTAVSSGDFGFVTRDNGQQVAFGLADAQPVVAADFTPPQIDDGQAATSGFGQPSISRSFVQFGTSMGLSVYRNTCAVKAIGTVGNDSLLGTTGSDDSFGRAGDDRLIGMVGDDCLRGNSGNDRLASGDGDDFLLGGFGNDTLFGGLGDDDLSGGSDDDRLTGGPGDDRLRGGPGNDSLRGTAGNDRLSGGKGVDLLTGGQGDDVINAVDGEADRVSCGLGNDVARVDDIDKVAANCERDVVRDPQG